MKTQPQTAEDFNREAGIGSTSLAANDPPAPTLAAKAAPIFSIPPEAIDAAVIQLRDLIVYADGAPEDVKKTGADFLSALERWADLLRKG